MNSPLPSQPLPSVAELDQLQALAERYARYNRSAGGLSSVLGGSLSLLMFSIALFVELGQTSRLLLASAPLLWLLAKELLRRLYYQRAGTVTEQLSQAMWRLHLGLTGFVALVSLVIIGAGIGKFGLFGLFALPWPQLAYFAFVALLPAVVWRWLWSTSDFIVGVGIFCQAAVIIAGGHYRLDSLGAYLICTGVFSMLLGIKEHRDYLQLRHELTQRSRGEQAL